LIDNDLAVHAGVFQADVTDVDQPRKAVRRARQHGLMPQNYDCAVDCQIGSLIYTRVLR
jgi:hypothetical protein